MRVKEVLTRIINLLVAEELNTGTVSGNYTTFKIWRFGKTVTITAIGPKNLPAGQTNLVTLPEGWRPPYDIIFMTQNPTVPGSTNYTLRYGIAANGLVSVYNYGAAITSNSNSSGAITYIAS